MSNRFDPRPLARGVGQGLHLRRQTGAEPADRLARFVLLGTPLAVLGMFVWFRWTLDRVDPLIAGFALFGAALVAAFPQLASWRDRLTERNRKTEGVARRALDEAAAHILMSAELCMVSTGISVVIANVVDPNRPDHSGTEWPLVITSGALAAIGSYILLSSLVAVNLLWDAYQRAGQAAPEATREIETEAATARRVTPDP